MPQRNQRPPPRPPPSTLGALRPPRADVNLPDESAGERVGTLPFGARSRDPLKQGYRDQLRDRPRDDFREENSRAIFGGDPDDPRWDEHVRRGGTRPDDPATPRTRPSGRFGREALMDEPAEAPAESDADVRAAIAREEALQRRRSPVGYVGGRTDDGREFRRPVYAGDPDAPQGVSATMRSREMVRHPDGTDTVRSESGDQPAAIRTLPPGTPAVPKGPRKAPTRNTKSGRFIRDRRKAPTTLGGIR